MGDPKRVTNKYKTPRHPWQKDRLEAEKPLVKTYGLGNKKELWKIDSKLTAFKDNAKSLVARKGAQAEKERTQLFQRLKSYNLMETESLDEVLGLKIEQLLDRRLQTILLKKGLARTIKQARQMITHRHISVNGRKITSPGYLVRVREENSVEFYPGSNFKDENHPERIQKEVTKTEEVKKQGAPDKKEESKSNKKEEKKPSKTKDKKETASTPKPSKDKPESEEVKK